MNVRSRRTRALASIVAAALLALPGPARADEDRQAQAQALFLEAMKLLAKKQYAEACDKLARSQELDPGMGSQFRLAECYEKLGRLASATALYTQVAEAAHAAGKLDRELVAQKRAAALEPKVAKLTILLPPAVASLPGLTVERDGAPLDPSLWGAPIPIDPGDHLVSVKAPRHKPFEGKVWAEPSARLTVAVAALESVPVPFDDSARLPKSTVPTIVLGAAGGVGIVLGVTLAGVRAIKAGEAHSLHDTIVAAKGDCVSGGMGANVANCSALRAAAASGDRLGTASIVSFTVGGVALLGMATYLLLPAPRVPRPKEMGVSWAPVVGAGEAGIAAWGRF